MNKQLELKRKLDRHKDYVAIYAKQMRQLTDKICERRESVDRLQAAIDRLSRADEASFNQRVISANLRAASQPLKVGQRYQYGGTILEVSQVAEGKFAIVDSDMIRVAGKDLNSVAEVFYFDFPEAKLLK